MSVASDELVRLVATMTGGTLWGIVASPATGSRFTIEIGTKRLEPPRWSGKQRERGQLSLFVECPWRLEVAEKVVATSRDDPRDDGPMQSRLAHLEQQRITEATLIEPKKDLVVVAGEVRLSLFCDASPSSKDSYVLYTNEQVVAVQFDGLVLVADSDESSLPKKPGVP